MGNILYKMVISMLKIAICDDEKAICAELEENLKEMEQTFFEKIEVEVFFSGEELYRFLCNKTYFDIIFLDIELDNMNGIEVGRKIREELSNETTQIIYISGKESYAMQLFKVRPLDFITKPFNYEKITEVLKTALKLIRKSNNVFVFQIGHATHKIPVKNIIYFESTEKKVKIITQESCFVFYGKLTEIHNEMSNLGFINIHKSYLVNYNHIVKFEYDKVTMSNKMVLPISQKNRKEVRKKQLKLRRGDQ